jgi:hypothetical protein
MFDFLYVLPNIWISALFGVAMFLAVAGLPFVLCPLLKLERDKDTADFAVRGQSTVISFLAIVLGFSLVNAQGTSRTVQAHVAAEASNINQMDRLLLRFGDPKVAAMRPLLADYAQSIVSNEWPLLERGDVHELDTKASPPFGKLSRAVYTIEPSPGRQTEIYNQILSRIDEMSDMRSQRIEDSQSRLPAAFWEIILALFVLLVVLALLIEPTGGRAIAVGGQALAVALLLSLVFIYDVPFKGQNAVQPNAIVKVMGIMSSRTS